jgi:predicted transcriptional regulator
LALQSDDFTAKLMDDMDARLLDFIKNKVNSFIKWDLVRFFYENPNTTDSVENIAKYAGRNTAAVQSELEELAESGVMEKQLVDDLTVYSLASDEEMRRLVDEFILACEDRHFRVKAVYHIIRGMR